MKPEEKPTAAKPPSIGREPVRVKRLTFDTTQVVIPGAMVNTISYDPKHPQHEHWEIWFLPQLNQFWIKNWHPKHENNDELLVPISRVSTWTPYYGP